ncbi:MAG: porin family protein [Chlamydiales bacterium]|nr:porin family protein [Chlamydiia bacterium]MCP5507944.1 porin family protein [Chlamydiales bacterium]
MKLLLLFILTIAFQSAHARGYITPHAGVSYVQSVDEVLQIPLGNAGISSLVSCKGTFEPGCAIGCATGYQCNHYRIEIDYTHSRNELYRMVSELDPERDQSYHFYSGFIETDQLMLNGCYQLGICSPFTPYLGAGIGYVRLSTEQILGFTFFDGETVNENVHCFGYNLKAGVDYCINERVRFNIFYSFTDLNQVNLKDLLGNSFAIYFRMHCLNAGLQLSY